MTSPSKFQQMPKWLESMKVQDGAPAWLAPASSAGNIANVHGALIELEKWVPGAGLAMLQIFIPAKLQYEDDNVKYNMHKRF